MLTANQCSCIDDVTNEWPLWMCGASPRHVYCVVCVQSRSLVLRSELATEPMRLRFCNSQATVAAKYRNRLDGSAVTETHTALPLYTRTCTDNPSSTYHSIQHRILTKETPKDVRCLFCVNQRILFMNFTDYIPNKYINSTLNNHAHLRISVSVQLYVN